MIIIPKKDGYADSLVDFIKTSENNVQLELDKVYDELSENYIKSLKTGKILYKIKNRDVLENRKKELELFLKEYAKRKDIESNDNFKNFLEIDKHSPDLTYNSPNIIYENNELPHLKIRCLCDKCEFTMGKKIDAYISVGSVFAFKVVLDVLDKKGVIDIDKENSILQVNRNPNPPPPKNPESKPKDFSTAILDRKKAPYRLIAEDGKGQSEDASVIQLTQKKMDELEIIKSETVLLKGKNRKETICICLPDDIGKLIDDKIRMGKIVRNT